MRNVAVCLATLTLAVRQAAALYTVGLDAPPLAANSFWNGSDQAGGFLGSGVFFRNDYNAAYHSWSGFALSRVNDTNTPGWGNQYAVISGTDVSGDGAYAVAYDDPWAEADIVTFPVPSCVKGVYVNNTTYAALSMRNGDSYAKQFGGTDGTDPDWFKLTVTGRDAAGNAVGSVDFHLADYRSADPARDCIVRDWTWIDLTPLGPSVKTLHFTLSSTDNGMWGMNTPAFFALDGLQYTPGRQAVQATLEDPSVPTNLYWNGSTGAGGFASGGLFFRNDYNASYDSWSGLACSRVNDTTTPGYGNQYAVVSGSGVGGTGTYAVAYDDAWAEADIVTLPFRSQVRDLYVNNTTYAALSMKNGDSLAKKFGGVSGDESDWFKLTITGQDEAGKAVGSVDFYLADCRFANNSQDYIITNWTRVDLTALGPDVKTLHFALSSSDNGVWGMNTPAYFALDNIEYVPAYSGPEGDANAPDGGVPGFVGPDGEGNSVGSNNWINAAFAAWADEVVDYSPAPDVDGDWTNTHACLGPVKGENFDVLSLGDLSVAQIASNVPAGRMTLHFDTPISDEEGPDFAVFENGLLDASLLFAEFAYVEVSSDGTNFARFPSVSLLTNAPGAYGTVDARLINNLAGKHANADDNCWGTPFDLAEVACDPLVRAGSVDLRHVRYVRLIDIPGSGDFSDGSTPPHPVYDSWPTYGSGGFDLEAVGVINSPDYVRVETDAGPHGHILPYGAPRGLVSVPQGSNATFQIVPDAGFHVLDVRVNGQSLGRPDRCTFTSLTNDQRLSASFGNALTVESAHGTTEPERGTTLGSGSLTCSVTDSPITRGGTQYVCVGWAGTGSVPSNGASATATFELTRDSSITWLWATNHWLSIAAGRGGSAGRESGWYGSGSVTSVAVADPYFQFAGWSGDTEGDTNATAMVLSMDGPRTLRARFWTEMATNNTPVPWLLAFGLTNAPNDAALSDTDKDGMPTWQEWLAGSDPTNGESSLRIVNSGTVDGSNYLTWVGGTNGARLPFTVERCTNLPSAWAPVGGAITRSPTGTNTWRRQDGADPNTFYRIKVTDPAN